jgi:tetratricopeptide (TPR) repeat protein
MRRSARPVPERRIRGYRGSVSPFARVVALTAAAAAAAVVVVVGIVVLQTDPVEGSAPAPVARKGAPPLMLELGVRSDAEAVALRRAARLYGAGKRVAAGTSFARIDTVEARVGQAFATWPAGTVDRLNRLAGLHARDAVVQLNLGVALFWAGLPGAEDAWRAAAAAEPDSPYAVAAGNLLHPEYARGIPVFVTSAPLPRGLEGLAPAAQLELLRRNAERSVDGKLVYGVALQRLGRQRSAERVFARAAREAPGSVEAQVAAAVGRFDKARPADAFSRLGPLTRRFPDRATVRFHLGLLLLWSGQVAEAKTQLVRATTVEPGSPLAREARKYLDELDKAGV